MAGQQHRLWVADGYTTWDPSGFTSAMISISVAIQMFVFVTAGAFADFGPYRKTMLMVMSTIGAILCILVIGVNTTQWWGAGLLMVLINVFYGESALLVRLMHVIAQ